MERQSDHTREVEKRVMAIPIKARDSCGFFVARDGALAPRGECFFCKYAKFEAEQTGQSAGGYCKFGK